MGISCFATFIAIAPALRVIPVIPDACGACSPGPRLFAVAATKRGPGARPLASAGMTEKKLVVELMPGARASRPLFFWGHGGEGD